MFPRPTPITRSQEKRNGQQCADMRLFRPQPERRAALTQHSGGRAVQTVSDSHLDASELRSTDCRRKESGKLYSGSQKGLYIMRYVTLYTSRFHWRPVVLKNVIITPYYDGGGRTHREDERPERAANPPRASGQWALCLVPTVRSQGDQGVQGAGPGTGCR